MRAFTRMRYLDPSTAIVSAMVVAMTAWPVVKECASIIMQAAPNNLDLGK